MPITLRLTRLRVILALCLLADGLLFALLQAASVPIGTAHLASFAVSLLAGAAATGAWRRGWGTAGAFGTLALMAVFLRGVFLALLTDRWGWPAPLAIVPTVLLSCAVLEAGWRLLADAKADRANPHRWQRFLLPLVAYLFLLRLLAMGTVELIPEEAYYWNYAEHLDIGYLDHPPMVAWLIWPGARLFGCHEAGVRAGALLCWGIAAFFGWSLTRNLAGRTAANADTGRAAFAKSAAAVTLLLMLILPFFNAAGMLIMPDSPLAAAWTGMLFFLERALLSGRGEVVLPSSPTPPFTPAQRRAWLGVGLCLGLGMLSKYTIALVGLGTLVFLLLDAPSRRWFLRWEPYAAVLLAALLFSPVVLWNARNEWASFAYQTVGRVASRPRFSLHELFGSALLMLTPVVLIAVVRALWQREPEGFVTDANGPGNGPALSRAALFTRVYTLAPLAVFFLFSLRHRVKLEWTGPLWTAALPAMACGVVWLFGRAPESQPRFQRGLRRGWVATVFGFAVLCGAGLHYLTLGLPGTGYRIEFLLPVGMREFGRQIGELEETLEERIGAEPLVVGMDRNFISSLIAFYAPDHKESVSETSGVHLFGSVSLMYAWWFPVEPLKGRTMLLVSWRERDLLSPRMAACFEGLEPVQTSAFAHHGKIVRPYYYRMARGYKGKPPPQ